MENITNVNEQEMNELKQRLNQLITEAENVNSKITDLKTLSETSNTSINALRENVETTRVQIDGDAEKASRLLDEIVEKSQTLDSHINEFISKPNEEEPSKVEKVNSAYQKIMDVDGNIEKIYSKSKDFETTLFGNSETQSPGLKNRIEDFESEIKKKKNEWEEGYNNLYKKIDGLLPGATSTGLASAYQVQGIKYQRPSNIWSFVFVLIISGMISFALLSLHDATSVADAAMKIISRLPFFVPAVWLAIFASKQQSQNKRLQEEYAYKETLSKSY